MVSQQQFVFPPAMRVEPSGVRYSLLCETVSGQFLTGDLALSDRPGDDGLWTTSPASTDADETAGTLFTNVVTGQVVRSAQPRSAFVVDGDEQVEGACGVLSLPENWSSAQVGYDSTLSVDENAKRGWKPLDEAAKFALVRGPDRRLSDYLRMMNDDGYIIMPALLAPQMMQQMRQECDDHGREILVHSPGVSRTLTNPCLLRIMADYMGVEDIHFGTLPWPAVHQPNNDPNNMKTPSGGWHSDCESLPAVSWRPTGALSVVQAAY